MSAALKLFQGTEVESLFILANAKVLLKKNDSKKALDLLSGIKPSQSGYLQARLLMADTYLHVEKNRKKYTMCFKEVVEKKPTVESCLLLGEAFLNIQEPLEAIAVYRSALKTYPDQSEFISKIGSAFVMTHDYEKALAYYKTAVEDSPNDSKSALWYDFASLLVRIKRYDQAIQEINKAINFSTQKKPCLLDAKLKMLLGDSMAKLTQYGQALSIYKNARELLQRLLSKELGNDAKIIEMEIVKTCIRIGALEEIKSKSFDEAGFLYTEALRLSPENEEAAIALTKLYINQGNTSAAQAQLNTLLEINPGSETASVIMGDLMFRNASFPAALYHYRQIFEKNKTNYEVLAKMVEISTRICKIDGIAQYFVVSKATKNTNISIGYHFCYGLYLRATSSYNDTMKEFALCRRDPVWGERSLLQLVEMLLNPSENTIGGDALEVAARISQQARSSSILEEVATAERLIQVATIFIQEIQEPKSLRTRILECHVLMATKQKAGIEQALKIMMDILNLHPDYIPAIYGTSVAFMLLKQSSKARNQLKRMSEVEWNNDFGPEIEKSWILLADIYIQDGKYDLATALLKRVTGVNQSCVKAWEYLGLIMEKEQSFKDAADYYFKCWNLQRRSNPPIGFKLAFNYLKAKRYTDAIDICHEVLAVSPDYPKIKIEILDKSRSLLR